MSTTWNGLDLDPAVVKWDESPVAAHGGRFVRPRDLPLSYRFRADKLAGADFFQIPVRFLTYLDHDQAIVYRDPASGRIDLFMHPLRFIEQVSPTLIDRIAWVSEWFHGEAERRFSAVRL